MKICSKTKAVWFSAIFFVFGISSVVAQSTYDPIKAAEDARLAGERQRRAAIEQQRVLAEQIRRQNARAAAQGYAATPYGYVYNPRRAYRQSLRYGYSTLPQPRALVDIYGYPYSGYARGAGRQGAEATRGGTAPQQPYGQPPAPPQPEVPAPAGVEPNPLPAPTPESVPMTVPTEPGLEQIPIPPSEPGPREF